MAEEVLTDIDEVIQAKRPVFNMDLYNLAMRLSQ